MSNRCIKPTRLTLTTDAEGRILDITDRGAALCGYVDRANALGKLAHECIDARTRNTGVDLQAMHQRARQGTPTEHTSWRLTTEGWHYIASRYRRESRKPERYRYETSIISEFMAYSPWVRKLVLTGKKPFLPLGPFIPGQTLDEKDLSILRGMLLGQNNPEICKQYALGISLVEKRKGGLRKMLRPFAEDIGCCAMPQIALSALGLDRFILDNPHWLAYRLRL